ncbi:hypothetical protein P5673_030126 [Acropora cervicornis]|uniref:Uncharacterized protein n=1 Tax=Acropora cervicornis TaxID=6130 RepID=A0AAD9PUQ4_ACRCE|nr:hypothetical protein P5673_030126 [Acropora cervicornis]
MARCTVLDEMLCREILVVDPFTGTKKGTVERGSKWKLKWHQRKEEDAAETEQRVVENQKKVKDSQDRENAASVRKKAMERLGQLQKKKGR